MAISRDYRLPCVLIGRGYSHAPDHKAVSVHANRRAGDKRDVVFAFHDLQAIGLPRQNRLHAVHTIVMGLPHDGEREGIADRGLRQTRKQRCV